MFYLFLFAWSFLIIPKVSSSEIRLLAKIGSGTYASCYRAVDPDGSTFAVKVIKKTREFVRDENNLQNLANEVALLEACKKCDCIIRYRKTFLYTECIYLVMEYAKHGSLKFMIERIGNYHLKLPLSIISRVFYCLMAACRFLEESSLIHMDVHEGNVLVTEDLRFKLADFGLAEIYDPSDAGCGTGLSNIPRHYPPEVLFDQQRYTPKADVWSVGRILISLIAGQVISTKLVFKAISEIILKRPYLVDFTEFLATHILDCDPQNRKFAVELFTSPQTSHMMEGFDAMLSEDDICLLNALVHGVEKRHSLPVLDVSDCDIPQDANDYFDEQLTECVEAYRKSVRAAKKKRRKGMH